MTDSPPNSAQNPAAEQEKTVTLPGKLGRLPLWRQVATLAFWPFLEQILSFAVSTVDLLFAARLAEGAERVALLDALGLGGYLSWLMMIIQSATAGGVMAIVSRAAGKGDPQEARDGLSQGLILGLIVGLSSGLILWLLAPVLVQLFGLAANSQELAISYLRILTGTCPALALFYVCTHSLRGSGDTRTPFWFMVVINVANIGISAALVLPDPGQTTSPIDIASGLAWGTTGAWLLGAALILAFLYFRPCRPVAKNETKLCLRHVSWQLEPVMAQRIGRIAWPQGLEMTGMWALNALTVGAIARLPYQSALGAHIVAIRVESLSFLPGYAIGTAGAALVGQYLGASSPYFAKKAFRYSLYLATAFMGGPGVLFVVAPELLVHLILGTAPADDSTAALAAQAIPAIALCGYFQPALAIALVAKTCLRGAGATRTVLIVSYSCMILSRAILIPLGVTYFSLNLTQIWLLMMSDVLAQALLLLWVYKRGNWLKTKV